MQSLRLVFAGIILAVVLSACGAAGTTGTSPHTPTAPQAPTVMSQTENVPRVWDFEGYNPPGTYTLTTDFYLYWHVTCGWNGKSSWTLGVDHIAVQNQWVSMTYNPDNDTGYVTRKLEPGDDITFPHPCTGLETVVGRIVKIGNGDVRELSDQKYPDPVNYVTIELTESFMTQE